MMHPRPLLIHLVPVVAMDRTHAARSEANAGLASSRRMGERYSDEEEEETEKENERNGFVSVLIF
jgi:hypothetical protein